MLSINAEAMKIVRKILEAPEAIGVEAARLGCGATVIDMGQRAPGGWQAARYFSLAVLGGLGEVSYEAFPLGDLRLTGVRVMVDRPIESCVASALAGWRIESGPDAAILSGPAR
jgi:methenyltetrahydromethanopterin cyclohydrolase